MGTCRQPWDSGGGWWAQSQNGCLGAVAVVTRKRAPGVPVAGIGPLLPGDSGTFVEASGKRLGGECQQYLTMQKKWSTDCLEERTRFIKEEETSLEHRRERDVTV